MQIKRVQRGRNEFNWEGFTIGKLLVVQQALISFHAQRRDILSRELLEFLRSKKLVEVEPFGKERFL